jgi:hypothetical protein
MANRRELAVGHRGRSGDQWDVWQATYSPVGADGYPEPIWDKRTGRIDPQVAAYWRERYDLSHILRRDWATLGPKLRGKLQIHVGDMDNYYLNDAVYLLEDFLRSASPARRGDGELRRPRGALLERRPDAPQRALPAALSAAGAAVGRRSHAPHRAAGGGYGELALLN